LDSEMASWRSPGLAVDAVRLERMRRRWGGRATRGEEGFKGGGAWRGAVNGDGATWGGGGRV
jgi:hypothetical protein